MLTIANSGGSAWRWGHNDHFQYSGGELALLKTETLYFYTGTNNGTETVCDYVRGTVESRAWSDAEEKYRGVLLYAGTFCPASSTFDAPVFNDCTYIEGTPLAPRFGSYHHGKDIAELKLNISANEALDKVQQEYYSDLKKKPLQWTAETKANYEKLLLYDMPDWYYEDEKGQLCYFELDTESESCRHILWYKPFEHDEHDATNGTRFYSINDTTGEIS